MKNSKKILLHRNCYLILIFLLIFFQEYSFSKLIAKEKATILTGPVIEIKIDSTINPGTYEQLKRAIKVCQKEGASLLLILLDTPGGLVTTLRKMVQEIMNSPVPICVFVYPQGAQAASAGALLTLSAHIAAMAPGTNIGAAHPVDFSGNIDANSTMAKKLENDLAAFAISIAKKRGRNTKWAEEIVRKSISSPADVALKKGVIDFIATDSRELLKKIKGRRVILSNKKEVIVSPLNNNLKRLDENFRESLLKLISDPNIAYILMMLGMIGLYFEFVHPGTIFPGTVGSISLILALYSLHTLSANITGILLILLAFLLFVLEIFIVSHGILAISGSISLILGSIMLFNQTPEINLSKEVLWPTLVIVLIFFLTIAIIAAKAALAKPKTGASALKGKKATVKEKLSDGSYIVFVHGELWRAFSDEDDLEIGQTVEVIDTSGLTLKIKPIKQPSRR